MTLIARAEKFATDAHASIDQRRKYTGEPYIVHPAAVVELVSTVPHTEEMIAAAWLHDTVEDVPAVTMALIYDEFGPVVGKYLWYLTDCPKNEGNRKQRKAADRARLEVAPPRVKTIKLADLIHNTGTIVKYDPSFARVYLREKASLLEVLRDGDVELLDRANTILHDSAKTLGVLL